MYDDDGTNDMPQRLLLPKIAELPCHKEITRVQIVHAQNPSQTTFISLKNFENLSISFFKQSSS